MSSVLLKRLAAGTEQRRHQREKVQARGRYMLADLSEYTCQTIDMSPNGLSLRAPVKGNIGERVICYLDHFGRVEGRISRHFPSGFALELIVTAAKRERLADQLTWHANKASQGAIDARHHHRLVPRNPQTTLHLDDRQSVPVEILDLSMTGAALACTMGLEIGTSLRVGSKQSKVVRTAPRMVAVEFLRPIRQEDFDESVVL